MRVIVMFDLPTLTAEEKREYRAFHKFLVKKGFLMMQESIYTKLALNLTAANGIIDSVKKNAPSEGVVQLMVVTEKQFNKMEYIVGHKEASVIDSSDRVVVL